MSGEDVFRCSPIVIRSIEGRLPEPPTNSSLLYNTTRYPKYGREDVYIHMFGKLQYYVLDIRDPKKLSGLVLAHNREAYMRRLNVNGLVGSKLIYKRPQVNSAEGHRFMLKIYMSGVNRASPNFIRDALKKDVNSIFLPKVYHRGISKYSEFLIAKQCSTYGIVQTSRKIKKTQGFRHVDVFHSDLLYRL
jgi:hypothetical protein